MKIQPAERLKGEILLPGDKSISHRAAIFAALAAGETRIENFATNADCASTLSCLERLGVEIRRENSTIFIKGAGKNDFKKPTRELDCANSGTTMRLLSGVLAGQNFDSILIGDESLSKRPMKRVIAPLTEMGADFAAENNCAPLRIGGKNPLRAIEYEMPIASAQVKSCVLLAGLNADGETVVSNPASAAPVPTSRNHTELMLEYLGADIKSEFVEMNDGFVEKITISGDSKLSAKDLNVPSDVSSAAFFLVAASCLKDSEIVLKNVSLNPSRTAILEVLQKFGAVVEIFDEREICNEIVGSILVRGRENFEPKIESNLVSGNIIANLIDEIPILAVFGTQLETGLEIRGAEELRVKESDRIAATVENLRRMNATVEEFADGFRIGKSNLQGAKIDAFGDHRIAMAFSVAALLATGGTEIIGAEYASVSFPEFFQTLAGLRS